MHFPGKTTLSVAALGAALTFAVASASFADNDKDKKDDIDRSVIQAGWEANPVPKEQLNLKGKNPAQVALGSYLTAAGDCTGCHSFPRTLPVGAPGSNPAYGDPFSPGATPQPVHGPLKANFNVKHFMAGGRCFGAIQARNLTPDDTGRPRGLTEAEFIRAMRTGEDVSCRTKPNRPTYFGQPDNVCDLGPRGMGGYDPNKLQTMPWVTYHFMTDSDLKAIYAYLSAIPKARGCNNPENGCPGFSTPIDPSTLKPSTSYAYASTDECPKPPPPQ
jgi:hypothetical protein